MRKWTQNELEVLERQVSQWLEKMKIPPERLRQMKPYNITLLRDLVCVRRLNASDAELRDLVKDLVVVSEGRVPGISADQVDYLTHGELMAFFFPRLGEQLEMEFDDRSDQ